MVLTLTLITLTLTRWEIGQPNNIVASRTQLPLRLAWGMTVHAAQGLTIDRLQVDLGRIFADGQACLARTPYSLLTTYFLLLTTRYSLLTTHHAPRTTHHAPLTTRHSPHHTYYLGPDLRRAQPRSLLRYLVITPPGLRRPEPRLLCRGAAHRQPRPRQDTLLT